MTRDEIAEAEDPSAGMDSDLDLPEDDQSDSEGEEEWTEEELTSWCSTSYEPVVSRFRKPMKLPLTAPWGFPISDADVQKLKAGFKSRSMDDKYDLLIENPDEDGNIHLHIIRWMVREEVFILHIVPDCGSAKIQSLTWEGNLNGLRCDAEHAKKEAAIRCRLHLQCEFEALPDYPLSLIGQSSAYKKVDME